MGGEELLLGAQRPSLKRPLLTRGWCVLEQREGSGGRWQEAGPWPCKGMHHGKELILFLEKLILSRRLAWPD